MYRNNFNPYENRNMQNNNMMQNNMAQNISNQNQNNDDDDDCACGFNDPMVFPENFMYGQSYVPIQYIDSTFKPEIGLKMGTIFPELVSPYEPGQNMREMAYLARVTGNEGQCSKCPNRNNN